MGAMLQKSGCACALVQTRSLTLGAWSKLKAWTPEFYSVDLEALSGLLTLERARHGVMPGDTRQTDAEGNTGARIVVEQKGDGGMRTVAIWSTTGDATAVAAAKAAIEDTVALASKMRDAGSHERTNAAYESGAGAKRKSDPQRRSRMFTERREGGGRRGRGGRGDEDHRGGGQETAAMSAGASSRQTTTTSSYTSLDLAAEAEDLKSKGHAVDDDAEALAAEIAGILALNPVTACVAMPANPTRDRWPHRVHGFAWEASIGESRAVACRMSRCDRVGVTK